MANLLQDKSGFYFYEELPAEARPAVDSDFHPDIIKKEKPQGMPYLLHSYREGTYQVYRFRREIAGVQPESKLFPLLPWIDAGRCFVFK